VADPVVFGKRYDREHFERPIGLEKGADRVAFLVREGNQEFEPV